MVDKRGWQNERLGDYVTYEKGKKPKKVSKKSSRDFKLPYVNIKAFEKKIFDEFTDGDGCVICEEGDILMVWDGARSGFVGNAVHGALGSTLMKIDFPDVEKQYGYYFLKSKYLEINTKAKGVGIPHVDPNILWNYNFPFPSLDEQIKIVQRIEELFSNLDKGIESLKTAQEQLKVYKQAVLKWAFEGKLTNKDVKEGELPEGWRKLKLKEVCKAILGGGTPSTKNKSYWDGSIPWLSSADVHGLHDIRPRKSITKEGLNNSAANILPKGGILVVTRVGLGKLAIAPYELSYSQDNQGIILDKDLISTNYSLYYLSQQVQKFKYESRGTTISGVTKKQLSDLVIPVPSIPEQEKIVSEIEMRFSIYNEMEKGIAESLIETELLKQSILKKAFEGKLINE